MEEVFDRILAVNLVCSTLVFYRRGSALRAATTQ
jgi:hypothetical protein